MLAPGDEAPDGVDAQVCDVEVDEAEDEVEVDVVVGCDMPMSIYLQPIIVITFVSKLLQSMLG